MRHLEGVTEAEVNFGASKLTVYGETSRKELEKAGAFENLSVIPENESSSFSTPSFQKRYLSLILSLSLLIIGIVFDFVYGGNATYTIAAYASSILIGGWALFRTGITNLVHLVFDMKTLMSVAVIGAAIIGEWREGAVVVLLFAISEKLETFSLEKARRSIRSLMEIAPDNVTIRRGGTELSLAVEEAVIGDIQLVKPGEKIALDGRVLSGASTVNQAPITGESIPAEKQTGDEVFAGTLNEEGYLEVEITKHAKDTTLAKIIHLVEEAQGQRAPSQAFIDRFAAYYTPCIIALAAIVAALPPLLFGGMWSTWIYQGLAVLVVGCPCALVISTPVAVVTAIGNAARQGVLIKGGIYLEEMGRIEAMAFDKTGTLTMGAPVITDMFFYSEKDKTMRNLAALEYHSQHPLASAVITKAREAGVVFENVQITNFQSVTGKGIQGVIHGETIYAGKPSFFSRELLSPVQEKITSLQEEGKTVIITGTTAKITAVAAAADSWRPESKNVLSRLKTTGIDELIMLTGDHRRTAEAIGKEVGIRNVQAELLPEEKLSYIQKLTKNNKKAAMVGDGVNDAPALANAAVGIAMGGAGTDTALETADITLMADDLEKLPYTVNLSRKTLNIIKQNIVFALGVKAAALLLVIPGWLTLWIAIFADMGATLLVTLNALRLLKTKTE